MTQVLRTTRNPTMPSDKRTTSTSMTTNRQVSGSSGQVSQKIKNFFRITPKDSSIPPEKNSSERNDGTSTPRSDNKVSSLRNSRFIPHIGRNRSTTVASEGNPLDDSMSPTAHANPYFQHQGPPALRHHNDSSVPNTPPDTPGKKAQAISGANDASVAAGKEELARKLRRVASAPNAQGLFSKNGSSDGRPHTAEANKTALAPQPTNASTSALAVIDTASSANSSDPNLLPVPGIDGIPSPGKLRNAAAFRRTYSSNSIKVRNVEVGPGSFDKIKMIGKGDVGKVYLVREKKSQRLYAMKGEEEAHM